MPPEKLTIPKPPKGFELEKSASIPTPPPGFEMERSTPAPPPGFEIEDEVSHFGMSDSLIKRIGKGGVPLALGTAAGARPERLGNSYPLQIGDIVARAGSGESLDNMFPGEASFLSGLTKTLLSGAVQVPGMIQAGKNYAENNLPQKIMGVAAGREDKDGIEQNALSGPWSNLALRSITTTMKKMGMNEYNPKYDKIPDFLVNNPLADFFDGAAENLNYNQSRYGKENAFTLWNQGRPDEAADWTVNAVLENAPYTLFTLALNMAGVPATQVLAMASGVAGAGMMRETFNNPNLDEAAKFESLFLKASAEGASEYMGAKLFPIATGLFDKLGVKAGRHVIKNSLKEALSALAVGPMEEGIEEFTTGMAQGAVDMFYRAKKDLTWKKVTEQAIMDGFLGSISGVPYAAGAAAKSSLDVAHPEVVRQGLEASRQNAKNGVTGAGYTADDLIEIQVRADAKNKGITDPSGRIITVPTTLEADEVLNAQAAEEALQKGDFHDPQEFDLQDLSKGVTGEFVKNFAVSSFEDSIREKLASGETLEPNELEYLNYRQGQTKDLKGADLEAVSGMGSESFQAWAKERTKDEYKTPEEILQAMELHDAYVGANDVESAAAIREAVSRESGTGDAAYRTMESKEKESFPENSTPEDIDGQLEAKYAELDELDKMAVGDIGQDYESKAKAIIGEIQALEEKRKTSSERQPSRPEVRYSKKAPAENFYSKLERTIQEKMPNSAPVAQVRGLIAAAGVKQDEIESVDLEGFLTGKEKVTKQEILDFVRENKIEIKEVVRGGPVKKEDAFEAYNKLVKELAERYSPDGRLGINDFYDDMSGDDMERFDAAQTAVARGRNADTKFDKYTLPGGENYREVLLTLPPQGQIKYTSENTRITDENHYHAKYQDNARFWYIEAPGQLFQIPKSKHPTAAEAVKYVLDEKQPEPPADKNFKSGHFDQKNVLAHFRINDRETDLGKTLFIEEIQSDWHQKGRKHGYNKGEKLKALKAELNELAEKEKQLNIELDSANKWLHEFMDETKEESRRENLSLNDVLERHGKMDEWNKREALFPQFNAIRARRDSINYYELNPNTTSERFGVPDAPFKKTWHELALKRILRMAAEEGYDAIAWTTGEQQADRYDLSKEVDKIAYQRHEDGTFFVSAMKDGRGIPFDDGSSITEARLEDYVGKEIAQKIISGEGKESNYAGNNEKPDVFKELSGLDLKVGGQGMKGFYDQIIPAFLNKHTKKWGGRATQTEIKIPGNVDSRVPDRHLSDEAKQRRSDGSRLPVHGLELTPAMKEGIEQGQPLFSKGKKTGKTGNVREAVERIKKTFKNAPEVVLVSKVSDLPAGIQHKDAEGVYFNGKVYLVEENLSDPARAEFVFLHEVVGHHGLKSILGDKLDALTDHLWRMNKDIRAQAQEVMKKHGYDKNLAVEEVLADMAGKNEKLPWLESVYAFLRDAFRAAGVEIELMDGDIKTLLQASRRYVKEDAKFSTVTMANLRYSKRHDEAVRVQMEITGAKAFLEEYKTFRKRVGKMRKYSGGYLAEELSDVPAYYWTREKTASTPDEVAAAEDLENDMQLIDKIREMEGLKNKYKRILGASKEWMDENEPLLKEYDKGAKYGYSEGYKDSRKATTAAIIAKMNEPEISGTKDVIDHTSGIDKDPALTKMKEKYQSEARGAKYGYKEGVSDSKEVASEVQDMKDIAAEYAINYLPKDLRGNLLTQVRDAKTPLDALKAFQKIDEIAETEQKKKVISSLKHLISKVQDAQNISIEYKQLIQGIADTVTFSTPREATLSRLKATKDYLDAELKAGREVNFPLYVYESLKKLGQTPVAEMSLEALEELHDKISLAWELGRVKLRAREALYDIEKNKVLEGILASDVNSIDTADLTLPGLDPKTGEVRKLKISDRLNNRYVKTRNAVVLADKGRTPMDHLFAAMGDQVYKTFKARIDAGWSTYQHEFHDIKDRSDELVKDLSLGEAEMKRIGIYAANQQEGGREKLLNQFTEEEIDSVDLTENEMKFYEFMRSELDAIRPEYERFLRDVFNLPLGKVAGYFPFMTDFEAMADWEIRDRFAQMTEFNPALKKTVDLGSQKKRIDKRGSVNVRIDAGEVFTKHMDEVLYAVNLGKDIKMLQEIAKTAAFRGKVGDMGQRLVVEWMDLLARKGGVRTQAWERLINTLRRNVGTAMLSLNPASIIVQITAAMDGAMLIGNWAFEGQKHIVMKEWREFALKASGELRGRVGDDFAYLEFGKSTADKIKDKSMAPQRHIDAFVASGVWVGAYLKYLNENNLEHDFENPSQEASLYADKMMRMTQASNQFKDLPLLLSKGVGFGDSATIAKLFNQFKTFGFYRYANLVDMTKKSIEEGDYKTAAQIISWNMGATITEMAIRHSVKGAIGAIIAALVGAAGDEEYDEGTFSSIPDFLKNLFKTQLGNVPFVSDVMAMWEFSSFPSPVLSHVSKLMDSLDYYKKSKDPAKKMKWATVGLLQLSAFGGVPGSMQVAKYVKQIDAAGNTKPFMRDASSKLRVMVKKYKETKANIDNQQEAMKESPSAYSPQLVRRADDMSYAAGRIQKLMKRYNKNGEKNERDLAEIEREMSVFLKNAS